MITGDRGVGGKRLAGIVSAIALATYSSHLTLASATQPNVPTGTSPSRVAGETTQETQEERAVQVVDPDAPPRTRITLAPLLTFGGKLELEYRLEQNFDLNDARDDDLSTLKPELSLAFSFDPTEDFKTYLNVKLSKQFPFEDERGTEDRDTKLELAQAFVSLRELVQGLSLQVGRQRFKDDREWLYDEELDGVRVVYRWSDFSLDLSASRKGIVDRDLLNSDSKERIDNYVLSGRYAPSKQLEVGAYSLARHDHSASRQRPIFFGLYASGEMIRNLDYWLELAHVRGRSGSKKIRGTGVDVGSTYQFPLPMKPSLIVSYAFGTGDPNPNDRADKNFRQTGLQDNSDKLTGVTRVKYYGELFDPELSNLSIFTGGFGIRPAKKTSLELLYHYYLQDEASTKIRDSQLDIKPTGLSRRLGNEIDLIAGYRRIHDVDVELKLGYFIPGKAFPAGADNSFFAKFKVQLNF